MDARCIFKTPVNEIRCTMRVAVIGASGFIGSSLCSALELSGHTVLAFVRPSRIRDFQKNKGLVLIDDVGPQERWHELIKDIDIVIYLASPKAIEKPNSYQIQEYDRVIVGGATAVAEASAATGVKRMIFISSIKVNGEISNGQVFTPDSKPNPKTKYAQAKLIAEEELLALSTKGLPVTIIRPPVVYGPNNKGNVNSLINLLANVPCWAIPFGNIKNERSLIFIDNLVSAIISSIEDTSDVSQLFLVRDPQMLSTTQLCKILLAAMNRPDQLNADPFSIFEVITKNMLPRLGTRLYGSLKIDDSHIKSILSWKAPFNSHEGLKMTVPMMKSNDEPRI